MLQGLLSEDQVDSFNIPIYAPSPMEITELVERNGCFSIERLELTNSQTEADPKVDVRACVMHIRAGFEWIISKKIGNDIIDDLFNRLLKKVKRVIPLGPVKLQRRNSVICCLETLVMTLQLKA